MPARQQFNAAHWPGAHIARFGRGLGFHRGVVLLGGERRAIVRLTTGCIEDDVATPPIEDVPVGIGEVERDVRLEPPTPWLEAIDTAVCLTGDRTPRRFHLRA